MNPEAKKNDQNEIFYPVTTPEVMEIYKRLGRNLLISIMEMIGINKIFPFMEGEDSFHCRKFVYREILKSGGEYCVKSSPTITKKTLSMEILKGYASRFENFLQTKKIK